jgi:hypothetical protein
LALGDVPADWVYTVPVKAIAPVTVNGLSDGVYALSWFDPQEAVWGSTDTVTVRAGTGQLLVPDFVNDCVVRMVKKES